MFVELDGLGLPDAGVELEGAVVSGAQGRAVMDPVVQEPGLCAGGGARKRDSVCGQAPHWLPGSRVERRDVSL